LAAVGSPQESDAEVIHLKGGHIHDDNLTCHGCSVGSDTWMIDQTNYEMEVLRC
jgi:hypothetical protein